MKITTQLKSWLHDNAGLSADEASDDDYTKAASTALIDNSLTPAKLVELTKDPDSDKALSLEAKLDLILEKASASPGKPAEMTGNVKIATDAAKMPGVLSQAMADGEQTESASPTKVDHISMDKMYSSTKTAAHYPSHNETGRKHWNAGARVVDGGGGNGVPGRSLDEPSDLDKAICGAHFKKLIENQLRGRPIPRPLRMTDHDNDLWNYALHHSKWGGVINGVGDEDAGAVGVNNKLLTPEQRKNVLDDALSGGLEIAPIEFDSAVILTPLLHGEFFPRVNVVNVNRGRRIEGAQIETVQWNSGGGDDTAITLDTTQPYVLEFNTTIFVSSGSIDIGLDFLSDSPIDLGAIITQQYGQVLLQYLDEQVNVGDGTTEPEGVFNAAGTANRAAANGNGGPPVVGDYEELLFAITKPFKAGFATNRVTYGGREDTYRKVRAIAVDATDARRVFGMNLENYQVFEHPYAIGEFFTAAQINFVNWAGYRMYRRLGMGIKVTTEGRDLVSNNLMLITARARYGGRLTLGGYAAVTTNADTT